MTGLPALLLSVLVIAGILLIGGGAYTLAKRGDRKRGVLMLVAGAVMWGNVAIMTL